MQYILLYTLYVYNAVYKCKCTKYKARYNAVYTVQACVASRFTAPRDVKRKELSFSDDRVVGRILNINMDLIE